VTETPATAVPVAAVSFNDCFSTHQSALGLSDLVLACLDSARETGSHLEARVVALQVDELGSLAPPGWHGELTLSLSADYDSENLLSAAQMSWQITDLVLDPGSVQLSGIPLYLQTPTWFGRFEGEASLDGGVIRIERLEATGGDVEIRAETVGMIWLEGRESDEPELEVAFQMTFDPEWLRANGLDTVLRVIRNCDETSCAVRLNGPLPALPTQLSPEEFSGNIEVTDCGQAEYYWEDCAYAFCTTNPMSPRCIATVSSDGAPGAVPREEPPPCEFEAEDWAQVTLAMTCEELTESWPTVGAGGGSP
jgi:hypothetical protein